MILMAGGKNFVLMYRSFYSKGLGENIKIINNIKKTCAGMPFINGMPAFSFSHTQGLACVAVSEKGRTGIDAETVHDDGFKELSEYFTDKENEYIDGSAERFFRLWTAKEAVFKGSGTGLREPFSDVEVVGATAFFDGKQWFLKRHKEYKHIITVCAETPFNTDFNVITPSELLHSFS